MPYVTLKNGNRIEALDEFTGESKALEFDTENKKVLVDYGDGSAPEEIGGGMTPEQAEELDQAVDDIAQLKIDVARAESKADIAGEVANSKLDNSMHSHTEGTVPVADENGQLVDNYITNDNIATSAGIESSKLAFTSAQTSVLNSGIDATKVAQIQTNADNISLVDTKATHADDEATRISGLIPSEATTSNKLADKAFVNSSIATSTATFRGTFNSLAELEAYSGEKDENDYAFVAETSGYATIYKRYKYDGSAWVFEYELNNSSFTAAQWATINSGATSATVTQVETNRTNIVANSNSIDTLNASASTQGSVANKIATALTTAGDGNTIDANSNGKLEAIGLLNANGSAPIKVWEGTEASWSSYDQKTYDKYGLAAGSIFFNASGDMMMPASLYQPILGYGLGKFYLFGTDDAIGDQVAYTSTDGFTWDEGSNLQLYYGFECVSEANGILYAGSNYSTDGIIWNELTSLIGYSMISNVVFADDNCYYVMVDGTMYKSINGINFTVLQSYGSGHESKLLYKNGVFAIVIASQVGSTSDCNYKLFYGTDPEALASIDLGTSSQNPFVSVSITGLAYGNNKFLCTYVISGTSIGNKNHILISSDGLNWVNSIVDKNVGDSLLFFNGYFLTDSEYTVDGINWFRYGGSPTLSIHSYAASNTKLLFCGLSSDDAKYVNATSLPYDLAGFYFEGAPRVGASVYSAPGVYDDEVIAEIDDETIILSNGSCYEQSDNVVVSKTVADVHPDWLCNIENVGVKFGNKLIADASGSLVVDQVYDATSPNAQSGVAIAGAGFAIASNLSTVATSGDYTDLSNKPTIPVVDQSYSASSSNAQSGKAVAQAVAAAGSSKSDCFVRTFTTQLSNWTDTTDPTIAATYPKQGTNSLELLTIPYKASNKVSAYAVFSPADAMSGKYAPFAKVVSENRHPNQGAQITIYATETPAAGNQPTLDVTVFLEYGA
jgi:hypothetical protein